MTLREFLSLPLSFGTTATVTIAGHMCACGVYSDIVAIPDRESIFAEFLGYEVVEVGAPSEHSISITIQ